MLPEPENYGSSSGARMPEKLAEYVSVAVALHGLALAIVNLTPTPKDDEALSNYSRVVVKAYRVLELMAGLWSPLAKR